MDELGAEVGRVGVRRSDRKKLRRGQEPEIAPRRRRRRRNRNPVFEVNFTKEFDEDGQECLFATFTHPDVVKATEEGQKAFDEGRTVKAEDVEDEL